MTWRFIVLAAASAAVPAAVFLQPALPQDPAYHAMADGRTLLGIPNGLNVLSNLPFAIVGFMGLQAARRVRSRFADRREGWPYLTLFAGVALTAAGSSYYHLAPDDARLVWDRLPMTIGFAGLLAAVVSERFGARAGAAVLGPGILFGVGSVYYWYLTETQGSGDLRPYILVQFGSLTLVLLLLGLFSSRYGGTWYLVAGVAIYAAAKIFELTDREVFALGGFVSGHTLKHLAAAAGVGCVVLMLRVRDPRRMR